MQRLSTHDVPPRQRLSYLHDFVAQQIGGLRFAPRDSATFDFELATQRLHGDIVMGTTSYSAVTGMRERRLLSDGRADYVMTIHDTDYELEMGGRTWTIPAGDVVIIDESQPFTFRLPGTRAAILALQRSRLAHLAPEVTTRPMHHIAEASPERALLTGYVELLNRLKLPADTNAITEHVFHLVATMLGRGGRPEASGREAIGAARMALVKADIARNLTDHGLSIDAVARRQQVSPRYIQQLFAREGLTFSDHVRDRRIELAMKRLRRREDMGRTISDIAFETGFGDLSTFNRAFRRRFGVSPSDVRAGVMRAGGEA